ncbi:MAG: polyhydroxyalkanoic acid system family protein [Planctomycetota bacterium]|nr:polyhydroxyalkanoic acid system family protein [Planctomycetota bacterium]
MAKLNLTVAHDLGREEALQRLQGESDMLKRTFGDSVSDLKENWNDSTLDFSLMAYGMSVSGDVLVDAAAVTTNIKLPLAAMMFKGTIESKVRERLEQLLS